jgi:hypothetical protein
MRSEAEGRELRGEALGEMRERVEESGLLFSTTVHYTMFLRGVCACWSVTGDPKRVQ